LPGFTRSSRDHLATLAGRPIASDFDSDGRSDLSLYRGDGTWNVKSVTAGTLYSGYPYGGDPTDIPLAGDFDHDGTDDITLYRPSAGMWWAKSISRGVQIFGSYPYGGDPSDIPVTGDYDDDGYADIVVYRTGNGLWWVKKAVRHITAKG
jgi:hypothetical protein